MSTEPIKIDVNSTQWTAISNAGESGVFRVASYPVDEGKMYVTHTDTVSAVTTLSIDDNSFELIDSLVNLNTFTADNLNDVAYARTSSGLGSIISDMS